MPSYDDQSQPVYHPTVPVVYQQAPMQPYGHHLAQAPVVHPANGGMESVVVVPLPGGQQAAYYSSQIPYYMAPPPPPREPLLTPALVRAVVVAFVLLGGGIGGYFLFLALAELFKALAMFGMAVTGVVLAVMMLKIVGSGSGRSRGDTFNVSAKGRSRVQVHTGRGHNRGRRR